MRMNREGTTRQMSVSQRRRHLPVRCERKVRHDAPMARVVLTKGVSIGPEIRASHVKKSDSETGPVCRERNGVISKYVADIRGLVLLDIHTSGEHVIRRPIRGELLIFSH
jgi:hypothetical protein